MKRTYTPAAHIIFFLLTGLAFLMISAQPGWTDDIRVTATVDKNMASLQDSITFTVNVSGLRNPPTPEIPSLPNFRVQSASGLTYSVEVRNLAARQFACNCVDFRINGLGLCKHVEAVLLQLQARHRNLFKAAQASDSTRIDVIVDNIADSVRVLNGHKVLPRAVGRWFDAEGR